MKPSFAFCVGTLLLVFTVSLPGAAQQTREAPLSPTEDYVTVPAGTHLPLVLQNTVNTKTAREGDFVYFQTIYPVVVSNRVVIPVGSFVRGQVTKVKRPGRIRGQGELHVRFDELTLPNGYTVSLSASLASTGTPHGQEVDRTEGSIKSDTTKTEDITTVATTGAAGAGIGAIAGRSGKGTAIGGAAGAIGGLAYVLLTRGREAELPRGSTLDVVLDRELKLDATVAQFDWTGRPTTLPAPQPRQEQRWPIRRRIPF